MKKRVLNTDAYEVTDLCKCGKRLEFAGIESTLVGFFSPPGHDHDDNCKGAVWACRDCRWESPMAYRRFRSFCSNPECDWQGREHCGVCADVKPQPHTKIIEVEPPPEQDVDLSPYAGVVIDKDTMAASMGNEEAFQKVEEDD